MRPGPWRAAVLCAVGQRQRGRPVGGPCFHHAVLPHAPTRQVGRAAGRSLELSLMKLRSFPKNTALALACAALFTPLVYAQDSAPTTTLDEVVVTVIHDQSAVQVVTDPKTKERVQLPGERIGNIMVFKSFDHISYAYVLDSELPIKVGASLQAPRMDD